MSLKKINAALVSAYQAVGLNLPTAYELRDFTPPASSMWASVYNAPAARSVHSLGSGGTDNITGFFQISVYIPENRGTAEILGALDKIHEYFKPGRRFTYQGQEVRIRRLSLTPAQRVADSASSRANVTIYWDSQTIR